MTINEFLAEWTPGVSYIDPDALKKRFSALRGLSNARPDLEIEELKTLADNVLTVNQMQYESLAKIDPFKTYFEHTDGEYTDKHSGTDVETVIDTRVQHSEYAPAVKETTTTTPGVTDTNETTYGKTDDTTTTPTGMKQTDNFSYAYNATAANQPDSRTQETYLNNYKEVVSDKAGGKDTQVLKHEGNDIQTVEREGMDQTTTQVLEGDLKTNLEKGTQLTNTHDDDKEGYVLRDIIELTPKWVMIYDRIISDIFSVIGVLIATRHINRNLKW